MADLKTLNKLIKTMRKQGVLTLEHDGFKLSIAHEFLSQPKSTSDSDDKPDTPPTYTEQDALFWSSTGIGEQDEANH